MPDAAPGTDGKSSGAILQHSELNQDSLDHCTAIYSYTHLLLQRALDHANHSKSRQTISVSVPGHIKNIMQP